MADDPILRVCNLSKTYHHRGIFGRQHPTAPALDGLQFEVHRGTTLALVGASGSGKSTLARCITGRENPDHGDIFFRGRNVRTLKKGGLRQFRRAVQLIPQDPAASLNPWRTVFDIVREPMLADPSTDAAECLPASVKLLSLVGLPRMALRARARQFSGGARPSCGCPPRQ